MTLPQRELRGAWVATVYNIDWPSQPGLPAAVQRQEFIRIAQRAQALGLNALFFQVRAMGDAFYDSKLEPWSYFLNGAMGQAPDDAYDPLEFAIDIAHAHGLQLHAWFNPFRARKGPESMHMSAGHAATKHPHWVVKLQEQWWFDPSLDEVQAHTLAVIDDVVRRYDIDGVHLDDYFYPYPNAPKQPSHFEDEQSYQRYRASGGMLSKGDWRRDNINRFVKTLYNQIKAQKPWLRVGISPFGIWKPDHPKGIEGLNAVEEIYADANAWIQDRSIDYLVPQLYWDIDDAPHSFAKLLPWWLEFSQAHIHLWSGMSSSRIGRPGRPPKEIRKQITLSRRHQPLMQKGFVLFSWKSLVDPQKQMGQVMGHCCTQGAIPPALISLDRSPTFQAAYKHSQGPGYMSMIAHTQEPVRWWWVSEISREESTKPQLTFASQVTPNSSKNTTSYTSRLTLAASRGYNIVPIDIWGRLGTPMRYRPDSNPVQSERFGHGH